MKKQKITDTISVAEMLHMRNVEGMSNAEIAKRIGCSVSAVINHIGKQPASMTKANYERWQKNRKAKKVKPSTPVGEPTKPHESFADLVARVKAEAAIEKNKKELGIEEKPEPLPEAEVVKPAEQAKPEAGEYVTVVLDGVTHVLRKNIVDHLHEEWEAQAKSEVLTANQKRNTNDELHALVEELKVMFSPLSVLDYLKCRLYELGTPHIIYADREAYLKEIHRLLCMQEGVAHHD